MSDKNIIIHPIVNGVEDKGINLFPLTKKQNILDFRVTAQDIDSTGASYGEFLMAAGGNSTQWVRIYNANANIAAEYANTRTYKKDSYCIHGGYIYRCNTAITVPEEWNDAHWSDTTVGVELNRKQDVIDNTNKLDADLVDDTNSSHKFVSESDKTTWNGKQDALSSGTNVKTINNKSIVGPGNVDIDYVTYLTTAPTQDNTDGLKFVVLSAEPATKYNGYLYIITRSE